MTNKLDNLQVSLGVNPTPTHTDSPPDPQGKVKPDHVNHHPQTEKPILVEDIPAKNTPLADAIPTEENRKEVENEHKKDEQKNKDKQDKDAKEDKKAVENKEVKK